jgi:hypothetical protein
MASKSSGSQSKSKSSSSRSQSKGGSSRSQSKSSSSQSQRQSSGSQSESQSQRNGKVNPAELAQTARSHLAALTGRAPESVLALRKDDDGWKVTVELVELSRVPSSTDLLGCYVVTLDDDGELVGYERTRRYQRGQAGGEE